MVVLKFCGPEWDIKEKIVCSLSDQKSFQNQITMITKKLELNNFDGFALYRVETAGKPPLFPAPDGYIHPTTPVPLTSNPAKEKMKAGTILFVKFANKAKQEYDARMYESLLEFRQSKGLKGLQPGGEDVIDWRIWLDSTLNKQQSKDIMEFEQEKRKPIEAEEFKSWQAITFEVRQVAIFSQEELAARTKIFDDTIAILQKEADKIKVLESKEGLKRFTLVEESSRKEVEAEEKKDREDLERSASNSRQYVMQAENTRRAQEMAALNAKPAMNAEELEAILNSQREHYQAMIGVLENKMAKQFEEFQSTASRSATETSRVLELMLSDHNDHLVRTKRREVEVTDGDVDQQIQKLEVMLAQDLPKQMDVMLASAGKNEEEEQQINQLMVEQQQLLAELLSAEQEEFSQEAERDAQKREVLEDSLVSSLQTTQIALQTELSALTKQCEDQQEDLIVLENRYNESKDLFESGGSPSAARSLMLRREGKDSSKSPATDEHNVDKNLAKVKPMIISLGYLQPLNPQVFSCIQRYIELFVPLDPEIYHDRQDDDGEDHRKKTKSLAEYEREGGFGNGSQSGRRLPPMISNAVDPDDVLRHQLASGSEDRDDDPVLSVDEHGQTVGRSMTISGYTYKTVTSAKVAKSFALDLYVALKSPYAVTDYLCAHTNTTNDPEVRTKILKLAEEYTPALCSVLDLLLVLYRDREAELALFILGGGAVEEEGDQVQSSTSNANLFIERVDRVSGSCFYYCERVKFGQWCRPPNFYY